MQPWQQPGVTQIKCLLQHLNEMGIVKEEVWSRYRIMGIVRGRKGLRILQIWKHL